MMIRCKRPARSLTLTVLGFTLLYTFVDVQGASASVHRWCLERRASLFPTAGIAEAARMAAGPNDRLSGDKLDEIHEFVKSEMSEQQLVGLAVGLIRNRQVVLLKGYGFADRERQSPVTIQSMFRWASISKTLTAVAALQLWERGKLDLDANVCDLVPEFPHSDRSITARQLLCHQSGIVHYSNGKVVSAEKEYRRKHPFKNVVTALDRFKESPLVRAPRERFSYTTHGYILLSAVVERAGEKPFVRQIKRRICRRLRLKSLQPDYQWKRIDHRVVGYVKRNGSVVPDTDTDVSWKLGGGGFISTVEDLANYAVGLMKFELVTRQTTEKMWTVQKTSDGEATKYGLGFQVLEQRLVGHDGLQEKTRTRMRFNRDTGTGVVLMSNCSFADLDPFSVELFRILDEDY